MSNYHLSNLQGLARPQYFSQWQLEKYILQPEAATVICGQGAEDSMSHKVAIFATTGPQSCLLPGITSFSELRFLPNGRNIFTSVIVVSNKSIFSYNVDRKLIKMN